MPVRASLDFLSWRQLQRCYRQSPASDGATKNVSLSVQNFIVLPELLEQSDLLVVVPERLIIHFNNLKRFEPPLKIQGFTKTVIWHERTHKDPAYCWVRELIEKACLVEGK